MLSAPTIHRMNPLWLDLSQRSGTTLTDAQAALLDLYLDLLLDANTRMNLTRIEDRASAEVQHIGDALTLLPFLPPAPIRMADVGTGGGVPGVPLAIVRPESRVVLIEATQKKAAFLAEAVIRLGLPNVEVVTGRAEDAGHGVLRESFDVAIARAVGTMVWLAEWCLPLVKKGGRVLAMKGPKATEELEHAAKAIHLLGGGPPVIHAADLPGFSGRVIVEIPKTARTDPRYPRPATQAKGKPIG
jgi:16S rRNA (guanine527-N7)-methyltransferase